MLCAHSKPKKPPMRAQATQMAIVWAGRIEPGPALHNDSTAAVRGRIAKRLGEIGCGRSDQTPNRTVTNRLSQTQGVRMRMMTARSIMGPSKNVPAPSQAKRQPCQKRVKNRLHTELLRPSIGVRTSFDSGHEMNPLLPRAVSRGLSWGQDRKDNRQRPVSC